MGKDKFGISIQPEPEVDGIIYMNDNSKILQLTVSNDIEKEVKLKCIVLSSTGPFKVDHLIHRIVSESKVAVLPGNRKIDLTVTVDDVVHPGVYLLLVAFMFSRDNEEPFHIIKYVEARIVDDVVMRLQPEVPYVRQKRVASMYEPFVETEHGQPPYV